MYADQASQTIAKIMLLEELIKEIKTGDFDVAVYGYALSELYHRYRKFHEDLGTIPKEFENI